MNKLKLIVLLSFVTILSSCYHVNQKVTKLTKAQDLIVAMEQEDYLTNYNAIESIEINKRVKIEEGIEAFIQHVMLVKDREIGTENSQQQDQLLMLYAIHNPDSQKAIEIWANFDILFPSDFNESNAKVMVDMCAIKPGIFCKLRQSPYTLLVADIEVDEAFIEQLSTEPVDIVVKFHYKVEDDAPSMFFRKLKDYQDPETVTTTVQLDFGEPDFEYE